MITLKTGILLMGVILFFVGKIILWKQDLKIRVDQIECPEVLARRKIDQGIKNFCFYVKIGWRIVFTGVLFILCFFFLQSLQ